MALMPPLRNKMFFFPKFDNLGQSVSDVLSTVKLPSDVLLFTKKHSGSLMLVSGKARAGQHHLVVNSKNETGNIYSRTAEHCLRAHFEGVFGAASSEGKVEEMATLCAEHTMTFCFE
jgi:hypothetical protein